MTGHDSPKIYPVRDTTEFINPLDVTNVPITLGNYEPVLINLSTVDEKKKKEKGK